MTPAIFTSWINAGTRIWILCQDYNYRVFDNAGKYLFQVNPPDKARRSFTAAKPAFDEKDNTFIACGETRHLLQYNASGKLVQDISSKGLWPSTLAVDKQGHLFVGRRNAQDGKAPAWIIDELDATGKLLRSIDGLMR